MPNVGTNRAQNKKWKGASLNADKEDLPPRTFHNHRVAIEQMFDLNIECDKRNNYKYYIENIDDLENGAMRTWLLNTLAVNNLINESHKLKSRILFEQIPSGQKYLTPIIEAMRDGPAIEMCYHGFWRDASSTFEVQPYCVKIFKQRWYMIAYSPKADGIRIYGLDRIKDLKITNTHFTLPEDFDGEAFFYNCFGIIASDGLKAEKVLIKVYNEQVSYVKALPLHHSQKEEDCQPNYSLFSYYIKPSFDFKQEILSQGENFEVLEPEWFRKEISGTVAELSKMYHT